MWAPSASSKCLLRRLLSWKARARYSRAPTLRTSIRPASACATPSVRDRYRAIGRHVAHAHAARGACAYAYRSGPPSAARPRRHGFALGQPRWAERPPPIKAAKTGLGMGRAPPRGARPRRPRPAGAGAPATSAGTFWGRMKSTEAETPSVFTWWAKTYERGRRTLRMRSVASQRASRSARAFLLTRGSWASLCMHERMQHRSSASGRAGGRARGAHGAGGGARTRTLPGSQKGQPPPSTTTPAISRRTSLSIVMNGVLRPHCGSTENVRGRPSHGFIAAEGVSNSCSTKCSHFTGGP